jgi:hypothetical protein
VGEQRFKGRALVGVQQWRVFGARRIKAMATAQTSNAGKKMVGRIFRFHQTVAA